MIRFRFGSDDLLRTRFAITPVFELLGAVYALRDPGRYGIHRPWVEWALPRVQALDLRGPDAPIGHHLIIRQYCLL